MTMLFAWVVLLVEGVIAGLIYSITPTIDGADSLSVVFIIIHAIIMLGCLGSQKNVSRKACMLMCAGYALRLACLLWDNIGRDIWSFPDWIDTGTFASTAQNYYEGTVAGRGGTYSWFIWGIYQVTGPRPLLAQYVNVVIAVNNIVLVNKSLQKLSISRQNADKVIAWICLLPYLAIDESLLLRESIIQFFVTVSVFFFVDWYVDGRINGLLIAFGATLVAGLFHSGAIAPALGYGLCVVLYNRNHHKVVLSKKSFVMVVVILVGFFIAYNVLGNSVFGKFGNIDDVSDITRVANSHADGGASYSIGNNSSSVWGIIAYTPLRMLYFLASPVPWAWRGITDIISFFLSAFFYVYVLCLTISTVRKNRYIRNNTDIWVFLFIALSGAVIFSWGVSNAGAALRHRDKFISLYVILFAICNDAKYQRNWRLRSGL